MDIIRKPNNRGELRPFFFFFFFFKQLFLGLWAFLACAFSIWAGLNKISHNALICHQKTHKQTKTNKGITKT